MRLNRIRKILLTCLSVCVFTVSSAFAMPAIMSLNEIQPGMKGTAYTVVDHSGELKPMDVTVVGVTGKDAGKGATVRIIAKLSGPVAEQVGGLLSGMSGSPVYINGKLVGALSATLKEMSQYNALITPIELMTPILTMPDKLNQTHFPQIDVIKGFEQKEKDRKHFIEQYNKAEHKLAQIAGLEVKEENPEAKDEKKAENKKDKKSKDKKEEKNKQADDTVKENTADNTDSKPEDKPKENTVAELQQEQKMNFQTAGFSPRGLEFLKERFQSSGINIENTSGLNISGNQKVIRNASLKAGSAVGVAAVVGDFSLAAIGTVTAIDGNKILAFGHPFLHKGNVNFYMTDASVIGTASGPTNGMKISDCTSIIGRINQDRENGIGGILGVFPQSVPIIVNVKDRDLNTETKYNSSMAYDEKFLPDLVSIVSYGAIAKSADRLSGSTADFKFTIRTDAVESGSIERRNMFYDEADVGKSAVDELATIMKLICTNKEKEYNILDVKVDVAVDSDRAIASLVSASPVNAKVRPGETVDIKVTLKPYRKENETYTIQYKVPPLQEPGTLQLDIHGGGLVSVAQLLQLQQSQNTVSVNEEKNVTLQDTIKKMLDTYTNNEIVIEPAVVVPENDAQQKKLIQKAIKKSKEIEKLMKEGKYTPEEIQKPAISRFTTNYIIDNVIRTSLQVMKSEDK